MATPAGRDITIIIGDDFRDFASVYRQLNGSAVNITGYSYLLELLADRDSSTLLESFSLPVINGAAGEFGGSLTDTETEVLRPARRAVYRLKETTGGGLERTLLEGYADIRRAGGSSWRSTSRPTGSLVLNVRDDTVYLSTGTPGDVAQLADLPPGGVPDSDDQVVAIIDGVASLVDVDDLSSPTGFAQLAGGNAFTGAQTFDTGTGKVVIEADAFSNTALRLKDETNTYLSVALGQVAGNGGLTLGDGAGLADVLLIRGGAGYAQFLMGRIAPRVTAVTGNSPTWNAAACDVLVVTSITGAVNVGTNMTLGTNLSGETKRVALTGNGTHAITWGSNFEASGTVALPTALPGSGTRLDVQFIWNAATSKFRCIAVA